MKRTAAVLVVLIAVSVCTVVAQRRGGGGGRGFGGGRGGGRGRRSEAIRPNAVYDGRFTFVRVRYGPDYGFASQGMMWSHDYPTGEEHFMKILDEVSYLNPHTAESDILPSRGRTTPIVPPVQPCRTSAPDTPLDKENREDQIFRRRSDQANPMA